MALELKKSSIYEKIDGIIPLPLHLSKKRLRGYNQCDSLAIGIAENLKILDRKIVLNSMILKWENVQKEFYQLIEKI